MGLKIVTLLCAALTLTTAVSCQEAPEIEAVKARPGIMTQPDLSTFDSLIKTAELVNFFNGSGPFTVFAPSNEAFDKMDQTVLKDLLKPENRDELVNLINNHVILGGYTSIALKSKSYRTVYGKEVDVKANGGLITVDGAHVIKSDILGPNGVGYIIDQVLMP